MAHSHCTGPGTGQGPGQGPGAGCCVHIAPRPGAGLGAGNIMRTCLHVLETAHFIHVHLFLLFYAIDQKT